MAIYHNGIKISDLFHNGKHIKKIFHNGKCIYASISVGDSLYDGIPSKGIMLYGRFTGHSSNPLGIQGDSINLKAPLSSCPNGIKIRFGNNDYYANGDFDYHGSQYTSDYTGSYSIPDINIPKGSSSISEYITYDDAYGSSYAGTIKASINGSTLSFSFTDPDRQVFAGTAANDGGYQFLAITSITAY